MRERRRLAEEVFGHCAKMLLVKSGKGGFEKESAGTHWVRDFPIEVDHFLPRDRNGLTVDFSGSGATATVILRGLFVVHGWNVMLLFGILVPGMCCSRNR